MIEEPDTIQQQYTIKGLFSYIEGFEGPEIFSATGEEAARKLLSAAFSAVPIATGATLHFVKGSDDNELALDFEAALENYPAITVDIIQQQERENESDETVPSLNPQKYNVQFFEHSENGFIKHGEPTELTREEITKKILQSTLIDETELLARPVEDNGKVKMRSTFMTSTHAIRDYPKIARDVQIEHYLKQAQARLKT